PPPPRFLNYTGTTDLYPHDTSAAGSFVNKRKPHQKKGPGEFLFQGVRAFFFNGKYQVNIGGLDTTRMYMFEQQYGFTLKYVFDKK
ncbi:hypothetical protein ACVGXC_00190, partial [Enterobacter hormaechei]